MADGCPRGGRAAGVVFGDYVPVYDIEQRELERDKRLKQLDIENRRLAQLESRMDALLLNADSSSQTPPATGSN